MAPNLFGPQLVPNMFGLGFNNNLAAGGLVAGGVAPAAAPALMPAGGQPVNDVAAVVGRVGPAPADAAQPILLRKSSDAARTRAQQLLAVADADFRAQKYVEASSRYRRATQTAPDLADAHFRRGQAEIALSRYESAAKSCKRAVEVDPTWPKSHLRLAQLYGDNKAAKIAHVEKLAQEAAANPNDTDLRFLIGIELFFDGQLDRAKTFFEQAAALNPGDDAHLLAYLQEIDRRAPPNIAGKAVDL
jgi:tetratricopeptide (TPR) repeat protein